MLIGMRKLAFTLMPLLCSLALAATVYKWVDENGVVHYSDQPHANAEKLQVKDAQTFPHSSLGVAPPAGTCRRRRRSVPAAPTRDAPWCGRPTSRSS